MRRRGKRTRAVATLLLAAAAFVYGASGHAQGPPIPPTQPPAPTVPSRRETELEDRLRKLETMNQRILQQYEQMQREQNERYERLSRDFQALQTQLKNAPTADATAEPAKPPGPSATIGGPAEPPEPAPGAGSGGVEGNHAGAYPYYDPSRYQRTSAGELLPRGRGTEGTIGRRDKPGEARPIKTTISNGLRFDSDDGEFQLQFHDLTQAELRSFPGVGNQSPLKDQFFIPRQRWYFTGRATRNVEFYTVINRGYGSIDLLDAFINFNYDPRFQLRVGRTKTPTSYEYYQIAEGDLIAPERSLFIGNFAGNRQDGAMFHGQILERSAEWAVGVFNGPRRSFNDFNNDKDLFTFFNIRPWMNSTRYRGLNYFNLGGAFNFGNEDNPTQPNILTTANDQSSTTSDAAVESLSPTFFKWNNNVIEYGPRQEWAAWIAWYYKSFNILAEYDGGFQDYAITGGKSRVRVPLEGFEVTTYYFLTGEQISRRVDVEPNREFSFRNGHITGPGAVEVFVRYAYLNIGNDVFSAGLADRNLWTNQAGAVDLGMNWYPNRYTKIYLDWQHAMFGNPVYNGTNSLIRTTNLIWLRFQLFF